MTLKVMQSENKFWVYNPIGGRGRWCTMRNGVAVDSSKSMFHEESPPVYTKAIKQFLASMKG